MAHNTAYDKGYAIMHQIAIGVGTDGGHTRLTMMER